MARDDRIFYKYAKAILGERVDAESTGHSLHKDIMHYLLNATDPVTGKRCSRQQLNIESSLLIAAGADTTSLTLAAATFYLVYNPRVKDMLAEEVKSFFSVQDEKEVSPSQLVSLPYLRAVVEETLRLAPPVPSVLPREVLLGGITIDGSWIPEGTVVGVSAFAIHRNSEYYPEPEKFYPERWIVETEVIALSPLPHVFRTSEAVSVARQAFFAFSQGSRGCIGCQLTYYKLHTALAMLIHRFDMRLAMHSLSGRPLKDATDWRTGVSPTLDVENSKGACREERERADEFQLFDYFLSDRNGPMVQFRERREAEEQNC